LAIRKKRESHRNTGAVSFLSEANTLDHGAKVF
jgi:hypothetical protein